MTYINAGHVGGVLAATDQPPQPLGSTGPLISPALPPQDWQTATAAWTPGARLLLYTDGIPETQHEGELFEEARIHDILQRIPTGRTELLSAILDEADRFAEGRPPDDDRTLLTVGYDGD